ncbi:hypothetical protein, partial [Streptomyces sp. IBSBF 2390]|uniref:hypothetical protein n=1 Tax=Streptomyces sp. IBSBF 2390 TaxID=2903533 RepID=UPI002FDC457E
EGKQRPYGQHFLIRITKEDLPKLAERRNRIKVGLCESIFKIDGSFSTGNVIFGNGARKEVLDVTVCSKELSDHIKGWKVWNEDSFSDHRYIRFSVDLRVELRQPNRNPRKTDWESFKEEMMRVVSSYS